MKKKIRFRDSVVIETGYYVKVLRMNSFHKSVLSHWRRSSEKYILLYTYIYFISRLLE